MNFWISLIILNGTMVHLIHCISNNVSTDDLCCGVMWGLSMRGLCYYRYSLEKLQDYCRKIVHRANLWQWVLHYYDFMFWVSIQKVNMGRVWAICRLRSVSFHWNSFTKLRGTEFEEQTILQCSSNSKTTYRNSQKYTLL